MTYDPRTIAFLTEVLFPPIELQAGLVQRIHNSLYGRPELAYQNFQVAQDGIHLTNVPQTPGSVSAATFLPDRLIVREELRAVTVEDFATRLVNVASIAFQVLNIAVSPAQQIVVRSLITTHAYADSTEFLTRAVIHEPPAGWELFKRPVRSAGVRFTFPPSERGAETYNLRLETWNRDPRSVWVENTGSFTTPTTAENLPSLANSLFATYKFLTGPATRFIEQFDEKS
jgi:hypothetical protein